MELITGLKGLPCAPIIGELQLWRAEAPIDTSTGELEKRFLADPTLPGIIITAGDQPIGILSRRRLHVALSQPYGRDVFIKRPIEEMRPYIDMNPLVLNEAAPIASALIEAMSRAEGVRFEPLLVKNAGWVSLLEVPDLLAAQAALLEETLQSKNQLIEKIQMTANDLILARQAAHHEATHDALTKLPNRKLFFNILDSLIAERPEPGRGYSAVMFIDLDRFKPVNDSLGHKAGDALLKEVSARLCNIVRQNMDEISVEPVRPQDVVARLAGDEFAVLLVNIDRPGAEREIADRILTHLARPFTIFEATICISASIGILSSIEGYESTEAILHDADIAMYEAKRMGKARAVIFDQAMRRRGAQRLHIETKLRHGLERDEFVIHYQPIVDLQAGLVVAFEALIRWQLPDRLVYPDEFIGVVEESGLINQLGNWIFRRVFAFQSSVLNSTAAFRNCMVCINISALQFAQPDLCSMLCKLVDAAGIDPAMITLEVTERSAMIDPERGLDILKKLKLIGFRLALDDFGTGYSSLNYLHKFPVDMLKIDRAFVADIHGKVSSAKVVTAILALAKSMDMDVVAEGIETIEQSDWLRDAGCQFGQGYYFGRPQSVRTPDELALIDRSAGLDILIA